MTSMENHWARFDDHIADVDADVDLYVYVYRHTYVQTWKGIYSQ